MADPFHQYGFEMKGGGGDALAPFLGAYLAHKTGLVDFNDPEQQKSISKNGVMQTIFQNHMKSVPSGSVAPYQPPQGGYGSNADYAMQPVPPKLPNAVTANNNMGMQQDPNAQGIPGAANPADNGVVVSPVSEGGSAMSSMDMSEAAPDLFGGIGSFLSMFV
jgi:hypothetical protein